MKAIAALLLQPGSFPIETSPKANNNKLIHVLKKLMGSGTAFLTID